MGHYQVLELCEDNIQDISLKHLKVSIDKAKDCFSCFLTGECPPPALPPPIPELPEAPLLLDSLGKLSNSRENVYPVSVR